MLPEYERQNLQTLLSDTVLLLCRNSLAHSTVKQINALIGVTLDNGEVILVTINDSDNNSNDADCQNFDFSDRLETNSDENMWDDAVPANCVTLDIKEEATEKLRKRRLLSVDKLCVKQEHDVGSESDDCQVIEDGDIDKLYQNYEGSHNADSCWQNESVDNRGQSPDLHWQTANDICDSSHLDIDVEKSDRSEANVSDRFFTSAEHSTFRKSSLNTLRRPKHSIPQRKPLAIYRPKAVRFKASFGGQVRNIAVPEKVQPISPDDVSMAGRAVYQCTACVAVFGTQAALRNHVNGVHLRVKASQCPDCGESFTWRSGLYRHRHRGQCPVGLAMKPLHLQTHWDEQL